MRRSSKCYFLIILPFLSGCATYTHFVNCNDFDVVHSSENASEKSHHIEGIKLESYETFVIMGAVKKGEIFYFKYPDGSIHQQKEILSGPFAVKNEKNLTFIDPKDYNKARCKNVGPGIFISNWPEAAVKYEAQ